MKAAFYEVLESFEGLSVGDELTVRPDLCAGRGFGVYVNESMAALAGQTAKIKEILDTQTVYLRKGYVGDYFWSADLFLKPDAVQYEEIELDLDALI